MGKSSSAGFLSHDGPFPDGWGSAELGEIAEIRYGLGQPPETDENGVPMIRATNIKRGRIVENELLRLKREAIPASRNPYLKEGDIIVVRSGAYTGDVAMIPSQWAGAVAGYDLVVSPNATCDSEFCAYQLLASTVQTYFRSQRDRSAQSHLNSQQLGAARLCLPPLPEQKAIAHVLGTVQRAKEATEKVIAATRQLKRSLMRHLFTYGPVPFQEADKVELRETEVGEIPSHWKAAEIGRHTKHCAFGPRFSSKLYSATGNIATLRTTDLSDDGDLSYRTMPTAQLPVDRFEPHFLKPGDFLVTRSGTCGVATVFEGHALPVVAGAFLIRLVLDEGLLPQYLRHYFNSSDGRTRVLAISSGAVQKNISGTVLRNLAVPVPPIREQHSIVAQIERVRRKISAEVSRATVLESLCQSLLHHLMTGKVRVHEAEQAVAEVV